MPPTIIIPNAATFPTVNITCIRAAVTTLLPLISSSKTTKLNDENAKSQMYPVFSSLNVKNTKFFRNKFLLGMSVLPM